MRLAVSSRSVASARPCRAVQYRAMSGGPSDEPRKVRVYTRTGDKGTSGLFHGKRRTKDSDFFEALGTIDELNAHVGLAREYCLAAKTGTIEDQLAHIQSRLFDIGAHVATPRTECTPEQAARTELVDGPARDLEVWIDKMDESLPALRVFVLPGGGMANAQLHVARAVCRRAERCVVPLVARGDALPAAGVYLNRLSDYLFVAARYAAFRGGHPESQWQKFEPPASGSGKI